MKHGKGKGNGKRGEGKHNRLVLMDAYKSCHGGKRNSQILEGRGIAESSPRENLRWRCGKRRIDEKKERGVNATTRGEEKESYPGRSL